MSIRRTIVTVGALAITAGAVLLPAAARGQGFSLPDGALTPITQVRFNYRKQDSDSQTEIAGETQKQSESRLEGAGAFVGLALEPFILGGGASVNDYTTETTTFSLDESRRNQSVFATLGLGPLAFVVSTARFLEESEIRDLTSGIQLKRRLEFETDAKFSLFLQVPFLRFGYSRDNNRLKLDFETQVGGVTRASLVERYAFQSETRDVLLMLQGETGPFASYRVADSRADAAKGETFDFSGALEETEEIRVGWRFAPGEGVAITVRRARFEFGFTGVTELNAEERSRTLSTDLPNGLSLHVTQAEEETRNDFAIVGGLETIKTRRSRLEVGFGWRF